MRIVIDGAAGPGDVPGSARLETRHELVFARDDAALRRHLPDAEVYVGWDFRGGGLERHFAVAERLRWVHWCGAGVRPALFDAMVRSDVLLTNARGIHDGAIAEYVLAMVMSLGVRLPRLAADQRARRWRYGQADRVAGSTAVVFGVGSIGRRIASTLRAVGVHVEGVGRTARVGDRDFGRVHGPGDRLRLLHTADWVVAVMPETTETDGYFGSDEFRAMRPTARFVNVGRGSSVDERALVSALRGGEIAGAVLDVMATEPLPKDSDLWATPGLIITPHVSGDYRGFERDVVRQFVENVERFELGSPLRNLVDKRRGYVVDGAVAPEICKR